MVNEASHNSYGVGSEKVCAAIMRLGIGLWMCLFAMTSDGQIIDNRKGGAFRDEIFFNHSFLARNKIATITITTSEKPFNKPITKLPDMSVFHFDQQGQLKQWDKITSIVQWVDTLSILYQRASAIEVKEIQNSTSKGYTTTRFTYDDKGRLVYAEYGSAENVATQSGNIEPGREYVLNSESFQWSDEQAGMERCKLMNNYGLHYATRTVTRGQDGFLVKEEEELVMSGLTTSNTYHYNDHGWIDTMIHVSAQGDESKTVYSYDELGNVVRVEFIKSGVLEREVQVLYTPTKLIEAILDQDKQTQRILITKYSYQYREP
ncbi:MAG: hypothetical protein ACKOZY_03150 [Flavobacteriales bacterium]